MLVLSTPNDLQYLYRTTFKTTDVKVISDTMLNKLPCRAIKDDWFVSEVCFDYNIHRLYTFMNKFLKGRPSVVIFPTFVYLFIRIIFINFTKILFFNLVILIYVFFSLVLIKLV